MESSYSMSTWHRIANQHHKTTTCVELYCQTTVLVYYSGFCMQWYDIVKPFLIPCSQPVVKYLETSATLWIYWFFRYSYDSFCILYSTPAPKQVCVQLPYAKKLLIWSQKLRNEYLQQCRAALLRPKIVQTVGRTDVSVWRKDSLWWGLRILKTLQCSSYLENKSRDMVIVYRVSTHPGRAIQLKW